MLGLGIGLIPNERDWRVGNRHWIKVHKDLPPARILYVTRHRYRPSRRLEWSEPNVQLPKLAMPLQPKTPSSNLALQSRTWD